MPNAILDKGFNLTPPDVTHLNCRSRIESAWWHALNATVATKTCILAILIFWLCRR